MDANQAPQTGRPRPRLNLYVKALRRERIFSRLRLGAPYADIARDEGLTERRVRQIVADALKRQEVDSDREHALLQLIRLESAQALAAESIAGGDLRAIPPYLKVLEHLDRYQKPGATKHVYDQAARERLLAKLNRAVDRLEAAEARRSARRAAAATSPAAEGVNPDSALSY